MGLFSNDKKPCPVCGKGTPKLLATKIVDETPICSNCAKNVSMEDIQVEALSVEGLKEHLAMREENAKYIENVFRPTKEIEVGMTSLNIDETNQVFTIPLIICGDLDNPPVFKFEELIGYELLAESQVVERFHKGDNSPQYIPMVFRTLTHMLDVNAIALDMNCSFSLILYLSNPCWSKVKSSAGIADHRRGNIRHIIDEHLDELQIVTAALLEMMGSSASGSSRGNADSAEEELIKFKELLDGGVITQEEFDEKKKQF